MNQNAALLEAVETRLKKSDILRDILLIRHQLELDKYKGQAEWEKDATPEEFGHRITQKTLSLCPHDEGYTADGKYNEANDVDLYLESNGKCWKRIPLGYVYYKDGITVEKLVEDILNYLIGDTVKPVNLLALMAKNLI